MMSFWTYERPNKFTYPISKVLNDLLGRQSSGLGRDEVTYFYVGDIFVYTLALSMPIFKKKYLQ